MDLDRRTKPLLVGVAMVMVAVGAWIGSGRLTGRGSGVGGKSCEISTGTGADGVPEAVAHCRWPVPASQLEAILSEWGSQQNYFKGVAESTVLGSDGDRVFVRQVQRSAGISDREVVLEFVSEPIPNGRRYRWRKAADQSGTSGQNVETAVHEGSWEIIDGEGEATVDYHLRYLPGGSVPSFLVSMFLASGVDGALSDLRQAAAQQVAKRDGSGS